MKFLTHNYILSAALLSWIIAQLIKTLLNLVITKKFNPERLVGAGGMPSAHSAGVVAATVATGKVVGTSSPIFAVVFILTAITIYDAMGVRRAAGDHAKFINIFLLDKHNEENNKGKKSKDKTSQKKKDDSYKRLKEYIGHTPIEVIMGCLLGILIALILPMK